MIEAVPCPQLLAAGRAEAKAMSWRFSIHRLSPAAVVFLLLLISCADNTAFHVIPPPALSWKWQNPVPQGQFLFGVWGSSHNDVFAVGDAGVILHFDGVEWGFMDSGTLTDFEDVWGSAPDDVFAVGVGGMIRHFDGASWQTITSGTGRLGGNKINAVLEDREGHLWFGADGGASAAMTGPPGPLTPPRMA